MKKNILTIIFILTFSAVFSQNSHSGSKMEAGPKEGIIKGNVKSEQTGLNISYATIALYSQRDSTLISGAATKDDGSFEITETPYGKFYIIVDFIGFHKKTISDIKVTPNSKVFDCGEVRLADADQVLDEVNVTADKNQMQYKIDKKVVNLSQNINAAGGTIVDALESVPSVKVDVDGNVSLRGSSNFTVLIDGKPSVLSGSDALNQIPSSAVDNIEIITNPSAKYDPDGTSGIINVVMKKQQKSGFNGVVNAMVGTNDKYSGDFLFNLRTKKINYFISAAYAHRNNEGKRNSLRESYSNDSVNYLQTIGTGQFLMENYSVKGGLEFFLNDKNTLSLTGETGKHGMLRAMTSKYYNYHSYDDFQEYSLGSSNFDMNGNYYTGSLDFTHNFAQKGHKILFSGLYSYFPGKTESTSNQDLTDLQWNPLYIILKNKNIQDRNTNRITLKSDYTLPISETQIFEAGYQYQSSTVVGDYDYSNFDTLNSIWVDDALMSNSMDFKREIQSVYSTYSSKFAGLDFKAGLRAEYTNQYLNQKTSLEEYKVNRFDFFPSFSVSKDFGKGRQMQAAYSRRVNRPQEWNMNPFPGMSDAYTMRIGNPALRPEFIDSYDLSYQHTIGRQTVVLDAYYRHEKDGIDHIETLGDEDILIHTFANVNDTHSVGAELSSNLDIARRLKVFAAANIFYYELYSDINNEPKTLSSTNAELSLNSTISLSKTTKFQINVRYESPTVESQGTEKEMYRLDLSLRQEFFNKKLSVVLKAQDPFAISKHESTSYGTNYNITNDFRREQQVYMLTLSYKINNYKTEKRERDENGGGGEGFDM